MHHLTRLAILTALCCGLRLSLAEFPNVKPITALFFACVLVFGLGDSLIIMIATMLLTGLILGFSPIILGQILVYSILLLIFRSFAKLTRRISILSVLTGLLALLYGAGLDLLSGGLFGFGPGGYLAYWLAGLPFDAAHAISTLLFFPVIMLIFRRILKQH